MEYELALTWPAVNGEQVAEAELALDILLGMVPELAPIVSMKLGESTTLHLLVPAGDLWKMGAVAAVLRPAV